MTSATRINYFFLWKICLVAAMGGLLFGYDYVVIGGAKPFYESYFQIDQNPVLQGWVMSSAVWGCLLGAILSGLLADKFGRKKLLFLAAVLFVVSALGTALANSLSLFTIFRLIGGGGIGLASGLSPLFIAEVSPSHIRGRFVALNQLTIVIGILLAQIANYTIAESVPIGYSTAEIAASWNGMIGWRWMFGAEIIFASAFLFLMFFIPESPRWLVKNGNQDAAKSVLAKIGGTDYSNNELRTIAETISTEEQGKVRFIDLVDRKIMAVLALGVFLAVFQQWCGINVIFNYAEEIFKSAGYEIDGMLMNIILTGTVNLGFTFVAIATVDGWGRRPLMLFGSGGLAILFFLLGWGYYVQVQGFPMLLCILAILACFSMTIGPMVWVILSEIYPNKIRGTAMSIAVASLWIANAILNFTFPIFNNRLGTYGTVWIYAAICLGSLIIIFFSLPETKGKSLEEIEHALYDNT